MTPTHVDLRGANVLFETSTSNGLVECVLHTVGREPPETGEDELLPDPVSQRTSSIQTSSGLIDQTPQDPFNLRARRKRESIGDDETSSLKQWADGRFASNTYEESYDDDGIINPSPSPTRDEDAF